MRDGLWHEQEMTLNDYWNEKRRLEAEHEREVSKENPDTELLCWIEEDHLHCEQMIYIMQRENRQ